MNEHKELIKNIYQDLNDAIEEYETIEYSKEKADAFYNQIVSIVEQLSGFAE